MELIRRTLHSTKIGVTYNQVGMGLDYSMHEESTEKIEIEVVF